MAVLRVVSTTPAKNAYNISTQLEISLRFTANLDPDTVDSSLFYLTRTVGKVILSADADTLEISGDTVTFSAEPEDGQAGLLPQTNYTLTISPGIKDILGNTLNTPVSIHFTTGDVSESAPAKPTITYPVSGEYIKAEELEVTWTESATATSYDVDISTDRSFNALVIDQIHVEDATTTGIVGTTLSDGQYFIRVRAVNEIGVSQWSDVVQITYNEFVNVDGEQPTIINTWETPFGFSVLGMSPSSGTVNKTPTTVTFTFTEDLPATLTVFPTVLIEQLYGNDEVESVNADWSVDGTDPKKLVFDPEDGLIGNATYTFSFPYNFISDNANYIVGETNFWLTTKLSVLYSTAKQLRLRLGTVAEYFTEEQLLYQIFLASVDYNISNSDNEELTIAEALVPLTTQTIAMTKNVSAAAIIALIDERIKEISAGGTTKHALGDLFVSYTYDKLDLLNEIRKQAILEYNSSISMINSIRSETLTPMSNATTMKPSERTNI